MSNDKDASGMSSSQREDSRRRWFRNGLIVSLALNLFLVGIVGVWAFRPLWRERFEAPAPIAENLTKRMMNRLPDADKPILQQAFHKRHDDIRAHMKMARAAQQDARRSLRADPFDPELFSAASQRARAARDTAQVAMHQAMREAAIAMSAEGRARLAQPPRGQRGD